MTTAQPPAVPSARVAGLKLALVLTLALTLGSTVLAGITAGGPQVLGALVGSLLVGAFFAFGALNTSVAAAYAPATSMLVALVTYTLQVVVLGLVFVGLTRSGLTDETLDGDWIGGVVIVGTLLWMGALIYGAFRTRQPLYDEPAKRSQTDDASVSGEVRG